MALADPRLERRIGFKIASITVSLTNLQTNTLAIHSYRGEPGMADAFIIHQIRIRNVVAIGHLNTLMMLKEVALGTEAPSRPIDLPAPTSNTVITTFKIANRAHAPGCVDIKDLIARAILIPYALESVVIAPIWAVAPNWDALAVLQYRSLRA